MNAWDASGAGASGSVGCGPGMSMPIVDKPVVLFDCLADFKSGTSSGQTREPVSVGVARDPKIRAPILT